MPQKKKGRKKDKKEKPGRKPPKRGVRGPIEGDPAAPVEVGVTPGNVISGGSLPDADLALASQTHPLIEEILRRVRPFLQIPHEDERLR